MHIPFVTPTLPSYSGPHTVGAFDLELPVESPKDFGTFKVPDGSPALRLQTTLTTLFYSAESTKHADKLDWFPRPLRATAAGYARFAEVGGALRFLTPVVSFLASGGIKIPASISAPLQRPEPLPLIIFSHGLAGTRSMYSQYCGELASRGYVVAAIEHRDGSAPSTFVYPSADTGEAPREMQYTRWSELEWPGKDEKPESYLPLRREQLVMRVAEVRETLAVIRRLNAGEGPELEKLNRRQNMHGSPAGVDWSRWEGAVDLQNVAMTGHSFGGATTIEAFRAGDMQFTRAIALDPWVDPVDAPAPDGPQIRKPLLIINSEPFTKWTEHFEVSRAVSPLPGCSQSADPSTPPSPTSPCSFPASPGAQG